HVLQRLIADLSVYHDPAPIRCHPLSLHDALPISAPRDPRPPARSPPPASPGTAPDGTGTAPRPRPARSTPTRAGPRAAADGGGGDRKSTRLNSSHVKISYAVFCSKKKTSLLMIHV